MDLDQQTLTSYTRNSMDHSTISHSTDSSELTAAAALTSLVSGMGHNNVRSPNVNNNRAIAQPYHAEVVSPPPPRQQEEDFEFPTQFTKSGRKKAVPFPVRLMKVLSMAQYEHIISWLPSGKSFRVHNSKLFTKEVLPLHFKSAKFSSFTRKLHRWGFMRNYRGQEEGAFFHDQFLRDRMDLASKMSCHSSGQQDSPKSASGKKIQQQRTQERSVAPPSPAMPPKFGMPRMPPSHMPDAGMHQSPGYNTMNHLYGTHNGFLQQGPPNEYTGTPQQRQMVRQMAMPTPPPVRQSSIGHMSGPAPSSFSPDLNVAIEMEVSRRLEEIMSVSANLEVMKEQAKMTAISRLQSYPPPSQMQQRPLGQQTHQQHMPQQQAHQDDAKPNTMPPMPNALPHPPQQHEQPSAVGAKTA